MKLYNLALIILLLSTLLACDKNEDAKPPNVSLSQSEAYTQENEIVSIGDPIKLRIIANSEEPITNIVISYTADNEEYVKIDSGLYSTSIDFTRTFWQETKLNAVWEIQVMNKERQTAVSTLAISGDPNSTYGAINEYNNLSIGMQNSSTTNPWFDAQLAYSYPSDSGIIVQNEVDFIAYFKYSVDNNTNRPSPTFSSPGEDGNGLGELYEEYYPELLNWDTRNYTAWDIRATNGINLQNFNQCHDDSLLIHSFDDTWGKKKYKWLEAGLFIPFQTGSGKHGIVEIISADTMAEGKITFNMKIQK
ncbi:MULTISPECIES: hypothetical protein [unclassified Lentimicrobium]|uniref:hypothetical protein n=1 Tax=unclassified Lentimicrobium TaxID=2677434 RepID=UPI0015537806|nr:MULTISPECIES: hypothetical protein [unclassified Lentimicrobium]NPD47260.1 hypothetical protein [Lentimicrobium sp. S6]NPD86639.1 hypothetical protein [Lentimicrobium sp. L6]